MFWQVTQYAQPSPVETLLDKDNFTLEELLDEEDIIQETKSLNGRLIDFLKQKEIVLQLLTLIVEPVDYEETARSPSSQTSPEAKRAVKHPYVACEIFCCEVEAIMSALVEDEDLKDKLFSILDQPAPLDCILAGYFSRVLQFLFTRKWGEGSDKPREIMSYLEAHPDILRKLVSHIETSSIAEVLLRVLGADEFDTGDLSPLHFSWMTQTPVLEYLMEQLQPSASSGSQQNTASVLSAISRSHFTPLAQSIAAPEFLAKLFQQAFAHDVSILALNICVALLERKSELLEQTGLSNQSPPEPPSLDFQNELDTKIRTAAVQEMASHLSRLREILEGSSVQNVQMLTPYGVLAPPLGSSRLKAVEVVAALVFTGLQQADQGLMQEQLLRICLDLFLSFPFNNLLHHVVTNIICFILENGSTDILTHILEDCKLVPWLVNAPEKVTPQQLPGAPGPGIPSRAGYLGHLTHIANRLAEAATLRDAVAVALGQCPSWGAWVDNTLRTRNDMENVLMWSCGRPSKREHTSVSSVDELDAGSPSLQDLEDLTGNAGASIRYSGFQDELDDSFDDNLFSNAGRANDTAAAFNSARFGSFGLAEDSSSSSSDDDLPRLPRAGLQDTALEEDAVVVASDSDDEVDMDDDTVLVGASGRVHPTDAGFTDFSDFGGFQPSDEAEPEQRRSSPTEAGAGQAAAEPQAGGSQSKNWNAFADPTDPGWASFQRSPEGNDSSPPETWDAFGGQEAGKPMQQGAQEAELPSSGSKTASKVPDQNPALHPDDHVLGKAVEGLSLEGGSPLSETSRSSLEAKQE